MATKRLRGSSWEYIVKKKGVLPKPFSITFSDEKEGDEYIARLGALLDRGVVPQELLDRQTDILTVDDAIRAYIKNSSVPDSDKQLLGVLIERIGRYRLTAITYEWVENWIAGMKREHNLAPSTIRHYTGALARCLDWLVRKHPGVLANNPIRLLPKRYASYSDFDAMHVKQVKENTERDRRLQPGELERIYAILAGEKHEGRERALTLDHGESLALLFDLAIETAMRLREMYTISIDQIDIKQKTIFLDKTKNGDKRQVPLSSIAIKKLAPVVKGRDGSDLLFPWCNGGLNPQVLKKTTALLSAQFRRIFSAAKCIDLRFHDLRHEATCRLYERTTLSDLQIAKITGHKDLRMLKRYANLRGSDLADRLW